MTSLEERGGDNPFGIPINDEIKALLKQIRKEKANLVKLENKLESYSDRRQLMDEFIKNSEEQQKNNEALCNALKREDDSQKHLQAIAERKAGGLTQETNKIKNDIQTFAEQRKGLENRKIGRKQKLEYLWKLMNSEHETMEEFLEKSKRKHDDIMAILKYSEQDEERIKSLTLAIGKKALEASEKHKANDKEMTETISTQLALDATTENFQQTHLQTQWLIQLWEKTVKQMNQRDSEINKCALQLAKAQQSQRESIADITAMRHLLDDQTSNNQEIERKIVTAQQQAIKMQQDFKDQEKNCSTLQDELNSIKGAQDKLNSSAKSAMSNISRMKKDIQDRDQKLKDGKVYNTALEEKLTEVIQITLSEEERAAQMDQFLRDEEEEIKARDIQLLESSHELFRCKAHLKALKTKEKDTVAHVARGKASRLLKNQLKDQANALTRQRGIFTEQDSKIINLDRKLARMQGDSVLDETQELRTKIAELTQAFEEKKSANKLTNVLKEAEDDIRTFKKETERSEAQKRDVTEKIVELNIRCITSENQLKTHRLRKQEEMVELNILKVEVKRIRDLLYNKTGNVLSLERRKLGLQKALKEREDEIKLYREMLGQMLKTSEKERQRLSTELNEKNAKIEKLTDHFETKTLLMAAPEEDVEKWLVCCIIKASQEKEELKRKGDAMVAKMRMVKQENRALDHHNQLFMNSISAYDKYLKIKSESGLEFQEKVKLVEVLGEAEDTLNVKKRNIEGLKKGIERTSMHALLCVFLFTSLCFQDKNNAYESLLQEEEVVSEMMRDQRSIINKLKKEITSQKDKIKRASTKCSKLTKHIRSEENTKNETLEEMDIKLKEFKDFNKSFDHMLREVVVVKPDLRPVLEENFLQANLTFPAAADGPDSCSRSRINLLSSSLSRQVGSGHPSYVLATVEPTPT
ncbi:coiled-coil domain-containing protein 39-like [Limanda limanda]|uniref:coiled-coil domain-containing protein 39-like n=1 Tax=Limanda limanda TaxID=27771 RepID=UPI0029C99932|nr:coiled-coil domain-containing protein 39-like [Limanda limanda]